MAVNANRPRVMLEAMTAPNRIQRYGSSRSARSARMLIAAAWLVFVVFACQRYEPDETVQTRQETPGNRNLPPPWGFAIYVLAGQSNMTDGDADIPQNLPENNGHIWAYTNAGTWALAQEPLDDPTG